MMKKKKKKIGCLWNACNLPPPPAGARDPHNTVSRNDQGIFKVPSHLSPVERRRRRAAAAAAAATSGPTVIR